MHMDLRFCFLLFGVQHTLPPPLPPFLMTSGLCSLPRAPDHPSHLCPHSLGGAACRMGLRPPGNNHRACSSTLPARIPTSLTAWA